MNIEFKGKMYVIATTEDLNNVQSMLLDSFIQEKYGQSDVNAMLDKVLAEVRENDEFAEKFMDRIADSENRELVRCVVEYALRNTEYSTIDEMTEAISSMQEAFENINDHIEDMRYIVNDWA